VAGDVVDDRVDESGVVDVLPSWPPTAAADVPGPADTVGIGDDDELRAVGQFIPAISSFGLLRAAEAAVHHDDQRCGRCRLPAGM